MAIPCMLNILALAIFVLMISRPLAGQMISKCTRHANANKRAYDFIVVGAGSGGATVASRLSERDDFTVLVLEAGGEELNNSFIDTPALAAATLRSDIDWKFKTVQQKSACLGKKAKKCFMSGGKVLGGSSSINAMVYMRGSPEDFNRWVKEGAIGWSYKDVLPYFLKSENNMNMTLTATRFHNTGGPLSVSDSEFTELVSAKIQGARQAGFKIGDINGRLTIGFSRIQETVADGVRQSTARAYLRPAWQRSNLDVKVHALVTKIIFEDKTAIGVEFVRNGKTRIACAKKEVIISAGAINSPKLLLLSGIGPRKALIKHGIKEVARLPVGRGLQDHPRVLLGFTIEKPISLTPTKFFEAMDEYRQFQTGILAHTATEVTGFAFTDKKYHQRQIMFESTKSFYLNVPMFLRVFNYNNQALRDFNNTFIELGGVRDGFSTMIYLLHPSSEGWVRLQSANASDLPRINPRYLRDPDDLNLLVTGIRRYVKLVRETKAMKAIGADLFVVKLTACKDFVSESDEFWKCFIKHSLMSGQHPTSTCKMGNPKDPRTVVDPRLRVKLIQGLRIVDASVMPSITSGNTNAPTIMIGERAADFIKKDHPRS